MRLALLNPALDTAAAAALLQAGQLPVADLRCHRPGLFSADAAGHAVDSRLAARHFREQQTDWALLPPGFKADDYRVLAMDMDSTLINIECIDEIADFVGKKAEVSAITEAAMRGEIKDFSESLRRRVALLAGVDAGSLESVYAERLRLNPGAEALLALARAQGWKTLLVSGGFTFFTERLKERLGLDFARSNTLEIVDGKLTGRVLGDIVDAQRKADTVQAVCQQIGAQTSQAVVMGDGANDLTMMALAGISVAYRAKPVVQEQARFAINFNGLDTLGAWFEVCSKA